MCEVVIFFGYQKESIFDVLLIEFVNKITNLIQCESLIKAKPSDMAFYF